MSILDLINQPISRPQSCFNNWDVAGGGGELWILDWEKGKGEKKEEERT